MIFATLFSLLLAIVPSSHARAPDVVFVPTPQSAVDQMLLAAGVNERDLVYDLGSGDGRIVVTAAKKHNARAVGFDIDPERVKEGKQNVAKNHVNHLASIRHGDIFEVDITPATVVTMYLLPELNTKLLPQLEKLKPGSRIVTYSYDIEGYRPDRVIRLSGLNDIYLYTVPLKTITE